MKHLDKKALEEALVALRSVLKDVMNTDKITIGIDFKNDNYVFVVDQSGPLVEEGIL